MRKGPVGTPGADHPPHPQSRARPSFHYGGGNHTQRTVSFYGLSYGSNLKSPRRDWGGAFIPPGRWRSSVSKTSGPLGGAQRRVLGVWSLFEGPQGSERQRGSETLCRNSLTRRACPRLWKPPGRCRRVGRVRATVVLGVRRSPLRGGAKESRGGLFPRRDSLEDVRPTG